MAFWSLRAPVLHINVKPAQSHPVTCKTGKVAGPLRVISKPWLVYLPLTTWTTPVPYLITTQSAATVRCDITRGKG